jgi:diacylglycerol kinase family enzyme
VNIAGIGFDAHIASQFNTPGNQRRGLLGYARITLRALESYIPGWYRISHTGRSTERRAILVTVANSAQFGNGARIAPGAKVDDGWLDLVVVEERSRWRTLIQLPRLFNGTIQRIPGCTIDRIQRATIESDTPMTFHVDGEPREGGTRLRIRMHPGALLVAIK